MQRTSRNLFLVALAITGFGAGAASAAPRTDCRQDSMRQLKEKSPDGYAVYTTIADKKFFTNWIKCDDVQLGLATAVHESVHHLSEDHDAFPLISGDSLKRPHEASRFYAPKLIAKNFDRSDEYVSTYLKPGAASAATDFLYLLDELNAYTHDLNTVVALTDLAPTHESVDHRDGLAALMAFTATYIATAEETQPVTWSGLQKPEVAKTVSGLWGQAERVMAASCRVPNIGHRDQGYIRQFCADKPTAALQKILGRAPVCPVDCLHSRPKTASQ
jgi:hypothetical protein